MLHISAFLSLPKKLVPIFPFTRCPMCSLPEERGLVTSASQVNTKYHHFPRISQPIRHFPLRGNTDNVFGKSERKPGERHAGVFLEGAAGCFELQTFPVIKTKPLHQPIPLLLNIRNLYPPRAGEKRQLIRQTTGAAVDKSTSGGTAECQSIGRKEKKRKQRRKLRSRETTNLGKHILKRLIQVFVGPREIDLQRIRSNTSFERSLAEIRPPAERHHRIGDEQFQAK